MLSPPANSVALRDKIEQHRWFISGPFAFPPSEEFICNVSDVAFRIGPTINFAKVAGLRSA
jgi:hypothetical protein